MTAPLRPLLVPLLLLVACGDPEPRYGTITLTADAPTAALSGVTAGRAPALEIAPGCAGYVDPEAPDHLVVVHDEGKLAVSARSEGGPVALLVRHGDSFLCDSDDNTGHEPRVQLTAPSRYAVHVASLGAGESLPYELRIAPDAKGDGNGERDDVSDAVSVTVTSDPAGASVRTPDGQVLGVTPAMFVLPTAPSDGGTAELVLELDGHLPQTVRGTPIGGELVLHAELPAAGPVERTVTANDPQPIRDFRSASQSIEVDEECTIASLEVEVDIRHTYIGDLLVQLRAPGGRVATLHRYRGAARRNLREAYHSEDLRALRRLHGEQARGSWQLVVRDSAELDSGSLDSFTLRLECGEPDPTITRAPERTDRTHHVPRPRTPRRPVFRASQVVNPWVQVH